MSLRDHVCGGFLSFGAHGSFLPRSPIAGSFDPKRIKWWCQISGILGESGVHYQTVRLCVSAANGAPQRVGKSSLLDMNTWWGQDGGLTSLWLYRPPLSVTHMRLFVPAAPAERLSSSRLSPPLRLFSLRHDGRSLSSRTLGPLGVCVVCVGVNGV